MNRSDIMIFNDDGETLATRGWRNLSDEVIEQVAHYLGTPDVTGLMSAAARTAAKEAGMQHPYVIDVNLPDA